MATGNTIEARLRIAADVAQAIVQLRELKREILSTGKAGDQAGTGLGGAGGSSPAESSAQRQQAAQDRAAAAAARKAERTAEIEAARARRASEREAADALRTQRAAERKAAAERQREDAETTRSVRANTNLQKQAYRQLPAQITDIATSLVSGQPAYLVAIQQGGQLRDSFGSLRAVGTALLSVFTPMRILVGGVAGGLLGLAAGAAAGFLQVDRLNKALALTGNRAGTTSGQVIRLGDDLARSEGAAVGSMRETLEVLIATGQQTGTTLTATAKAVTAYRKLTGATAEEAVKLFEGQAEGILAWAQKANGAYNFLTAAQLDYIRTLQAQGRAEEAVRFANEELAASLKQRTVPAIGLLERAWNGVKEKISGVVDAIKSIGRPETGEDRVKILRERLDALLPQQQRAVGRTRGYLDAQVKDLQDQLAAEETLLNRDALRRAEKAAADAAERDKALKETKAYTDALANVDEAGAQKRLQARLAALDREEEALRLNRERGLIGELEAATRSAEIDQRRLRAQAEVVRRQIEIERGRKQETPEQVLASQAAVVQLEAQLTGLESRIQGAAAVAQQALAKDALAQAAEWERAWREAADKIREYSRQNATTAAGRNADPQARARAEAEAQVAAERRALEAQQRDLRLRIGVTLDPGQAAELQRQLDELTKQGAAALGETQRRGIFESLRGQLNEQTEALRQTEAGINAEVERGAITTQEAERQKLQAREAAITQLERILELLAAIADPNNQGEKNAVSNARQAVRDMTDLATELGQVARKSGISELTQGLNDVFTGAKDAGEALRDMALGFAKTMLNVLNQRLAEKLVGEAMKALDSMKTSSSAGTTTTGDGGMWGSLIKWVVSLFHTGGVVGRGMASMSRTIAPAALATMQVLHSGGVAGMGVKPNEQLALLEKGEEVLTEDNPRHVNNFRGGAAVGAVNISVNVQAGDGGTSAVDGQRLGSTLKIAVRAAIVDEMRPGGALAGAGGR